MAEEFWSSLSSSLVHTWLCLSVVFLWLSLCAGMVLSLVTAMNRVLSTLSCLYAFSSAVVEGTDDKAIPISC